MDGQAKLLMNFTRDILKNGFLLLAALLAVLLCPFQAKAATLDWNNVDWTAGSLSQSFEIDSGNPGNDITITITGNTSRFNTNYPDDNTNLTGGLGSSEQSLQLYMNKFANDTEFVTVTITFNYAAGVDHVNFSIFDIDNGTFVDQIRNIKGIGFGVTNAVWLTGSSGNTVTSNNTLNASVTGTSSSNDTNSTGNAFFNFGNSKITTVSFDYGSAPGSGTPSTVQWVGFHDFRYRSVPEVNPALAALMVCGLAIGVRAWRRTKAA